MLNYFSRTETKAKFNSLFSRKASNLSIILFKFVEAKEQKENVE